MSSHAFCVLGRLATATKGSQCWFSLEHPRVLDTTVPHFQVSPSERKPGPLPFLFGVGGLKIGCGPQGNPGCINHSNSLIQDIPLSATSSSYFKARSSHLWNRNRPGTSMSGERGRGLAVACRLRGVADCCQGTNSQVCFHPWGSEGFPKARIRNVAREGACCCEWSL